MESAPYYLSGNVLPNINLYACSRGFFCCLKKSCGSLFGYIFFTAVRADHGRDTFNHKCRAIKLKSDSCLAWIRLSVFADGTLHVLFLLLKPGSHLPESGSYTVITIVFSFPCYQLQPRARFKGAVFVCVVLVALYKTIVLLAVIFLNSGFCSVFEKVQAKRVGMPCSAQIGHSCRRE